ncbi:hypothetical protein YA0002_00540 [Pseudomonas cichorii]|uniref:hypothetical protein n=1 Tax=Pseudomonas cichorii TaxID=36746 RepID=UPI0018E643A7|nr:hypothetical protein [Pseudomonas cichorii]MBI6851233.1 hypothetical protein [Pseudomonas cichorii]
MPALKAEDFRAMSHNPGASDPGWVNRAEDAMRMLGQLTVQDEVVLYLSGPQAIVHAVLAPTRKLTQARVKELQNAPFPEGQDTWSICQEISCDGRTIRLEPPLGSWWEEFQGEKLIFRREFNEVERDRAAIELSQKLVHSLDLYFVAERSSYCRLDEHGDIEDVIRIIQQPEGKSSFRLDVVTILRAALDKYMAVTKQSLVMRFDFTRFDSRNFSGWHGVKTLYSDSSDLYYHHGLSGAGSFCNGVMVLRPSITVASMIKLWEMENDRALRQYAVFKIYDRKNGRNVETSCAPECLSNYFEDSELPWEISPAFFRAEVLHLYKADPDKYSLEDRQISCRGSWYLRSYDQNEDGQVHAYIGDLAKLPYNVQLYWQSFNEWPKGAISKRAYQTDIRGSWDLEYEPVGALKNAIRELEKSAPAWWNPRGEELEAAVHIPATDSTKEWADEILALDQYLVEGFLLKPLRAIADSLGKPALSSWASLRVIQEILCGVGNSETQAKAIVQPLQRLHGLRTEVKGHATVEKKRAAELEARTNHGSLRNHFISLAGDCERALDTIRVALGAL